MSNDIKVRDKVSGEVLTLRLKDNTTKNNITDTIPVSKESYADRVANRRTGIQQEISNRGNYYGNIANNLQSPNPVKKVMGGLGVVGAPLSSLESGIANPALAMQSGNFNPIDLAKESYKGITGSKQGQFGDVYNIAGVPRPISSGLGLALTMSPLKAGQAINKSFGSIKKLSDKGIIKAGESLINATKEATRVTGEKLNEAYRAIGNLKVNPNTFIDNISKLPKSLINELEEQFGKLDELANRGLDINQLRNIKRTVGKFKPGVFGKESRGLAENIEADKINKIYGSIKNMINDTVEQATNKKIAGSLMKAEEAFTEVSNASDYIQKTIIEPTLRKATKAGSMASKLSIEGDVSGRTAMNVLKKSGARNNINKAMSELEKFNKWKFATQIAQHATNAALFGGVAGSIGGRTLSGIMNNSKD